MRFSRAFTLIELLIVVAIIAILAAIAVPNFLEAQTRAKVSRVKSDQRTVATAMEAYFVDYNRYPNDSDNTIGKNGEDGLARLTTPVGFITDLATDPFQVMLNKNNNDASVNFELASGSDNAGWGPQPPPSGFSGRGNKTGVAVQSWVLISVGTDVQPISAADDTSGNDEYPGTATIPVVMTSYDPTNGTISNGDIYRAGGTEGVGNYTIDGQLFGRINK